MTVKLIRLLGYCEKNGPDACSIFIDDEFANKEFGTDATNLRFLVNSAIEKGLVKKRFITEEEMNIDLTAHGYEFLKSNRK